MKINNYRKKYNYCILVLKLNCWKDCVDLIPYKSYDVVNYINCRSDRWDYFLRRLKEIKKQYPNCELGIYKLNSWHYSLNKDFSKLIAFENYDNFQYFDFEWFENELVPIIHNER